MTQNDWRPLSEREQGAETDALLEGVPSWLRQSLLDWMRARLTDPHGAWSASRLRGIERALRIPLVWSPPEPETAAAHALQNHVQGEDTAFLDVIDYCLGLLGVRSSTIPSAAVELENILSEAGSAWTVNTRSERLALERRVASPVASLAREVMHASNRASQHLDQAWIAVYGRRPNASYGYQQCVRAVEAAAIPVVSPNNSRATLGTVISDLRRDRAQWRLALDTPENVDDIGVVVGMLECLWKAQFDRHGTPDHDVPMSVSTEQAEAAAHLAAVLVHWFGSNTIVRTTPVRET